MSLSALSAEGLEVTGFSRSSVISPLGSFLIQFFFICINNDILGARLLEFWALPALNFFTHAPSSLLLRFHPVTAGVFWEDVAAPFCFHAFVRQHRWTGSCFVFLFPDFTWNMKRSLFWAHTQHKERLGFDLDRSGPTSSPAGWRCGTEEEQRLMGHHGRARRRETQSLKSRSEQAVRGRMNNGWKKRKKGEKDAPGCCSEVELKTLFTAFLYHCLQFKELLHQSEKSPWC